MKIDLSVEDCASIRYAVSELATRRFEQALDLRYAEGMRKAARYDAEKLQYLEQRLVELVSAARQREAK